MNSDVLRELLRGLAAQIVEQITPELRAAVQVTERPDSLMLDVDQVAHRLNLSPSKVRAMWTSGDLPSVKVGGLRRTRRVDLEEYVVGLPLDKPDRPDKASETTVLALVREAA
jgi:excisionase family DNA binding protein